MNKKYYKGAPRGYRDHLTKMSHKGLVNLYLMQQKHLRRSRQFALELYRDNLILGRFAKFELSNRLFNNAYPHLTNEQYHKLGTQFNETFNNLKQNHLDSGTAMIYDAYFEQEYEDYVSREE